MLIRKLISTEIWEPRGLETYLTEMEVDGLRLVKATGWFLYFEQAKPRRMRYRVEYIRHPDEELLALYDDCGWEYVTETNREVQIFRAPEDMDIPEIHTDAESEANMYRHVKQAARNSFLMAALLSIFLGWMLDWFGLEALSMPDLAWRVVGFTVLTVLVVCGAVVRYESTCRYLRMLGRGEKAPASSRRYRLGIRAQYLVFASFILYCILVLQPLVQSFIDLASYL